MSEGGQTIETETKPIARIGTDNFVDYLSDVQKTPDGLLRGDIDDFEKQIEVPEVVHQTIKEMYEQKRESVSGMGAYTMQRRTAYTSQIDALLPGVQDKMLEQTDKPVSVEQARVVFIDMKGGLGSTSSEYGYGEEVDMGVPFREARDKSVLPVVAIHTHPKDANFSFPDYKPLILGDSHENMRLVNSMVVLCPEIQIMAVATKDTPILSNEKADELIMGKMDENQKKDVAIMGKMIETMQSLSDRKQVVDTLDMLKQMAGEKFPDVVENARKEHNVQEGESEKIKSELEAVTRNTANEMPQSLNADLIAFSREMNVKLYFSQDMRTFKEFSA
jgi:hypothetical protein